MPLRIFWIALCCFTILVTTSGAVTDQPQQGAQDQQVKRLIEEVQKLQSTLEEQKNELNSYRKEIAEQNRTKYSWWTTYATPIIAPLGALVAAIGGWVITYTILVRNFKEQERVRSEEQRRQENQRREDHERQDGQRSDDRRHSDGARIESYLIDSLKYFQGGIQERSIGIGIIETYWSTFPKLRSLWTTVLSNQAVYILTKLTDDKKLPLHEIGNLRRIHHLLALSTLTVSDRESLSFAISALGSETFSQQEASQVADLMRSLERVLKSFY